MIYTFIILQECQSWQSSLVILQGNSNRETLNVLREMDDDVRIENEIYDISSVQVDDGISFLQVGWRNTPDLYDLKCWFKFLNFYPCCSLLFSSASLAPSWNIYNLLRNSRKSLKLLPSKMHITKATTTENWLKPIIFFFMYCINY